MDDEKSQENQPIRFRPIHTPFALLQISREDLRGNEHQLLEWLAELAAPSAGSANPNEDFVSVTWTGSECSLLVKQCEIEQLNSLGLEVAEISSSWCRIKLIGPLPLQLKGIMAHAAKVIADLDVSLFPIATYDTDHLFVPQNSLQRVAQGLAASGWIQVSESESSES